MTPKPEGRLMKHTRTLLLLLALLAPSGAYAQGGTQSPASPAPTPARAGKKEKARPRYETVQFESRLVGAPLPYNVILPADYKRGASKQRRYPVVYLLHGLGGSAGDWVPNRARLPDYAPPYPL